MKVRPETFIFLQYNEKKNIIRTFISMSLYEKVRGELVFYLIFVLLCITQGKYVIALLGKYVYSRTTTVLPKSEGRGRDGVKEGVQVAELIFVPSSLKKPVSPSGSEQTRHERTLLIRRARFTSLKLTQVFITREKSEYGRRSFFSLSHFALLEIAGE